MSSNMLLPNFFFPLFLGLQLHIYYAFSPCPSILLFLMLFFFCITWIFSLDLPSSSLILSPPVANVMLNHSVPFQLLYVHFHSFYFIFFIVSTSLLSPILSSNILNILIKVNLKFTPDNANI